MGMLERMKAKVTEELEHWRIDHCVPFANQWENKSLEKQA